MTTDPFDTAPDADRDENISAATESSEASEADLLEQGQPVDETELEPVAPSETWEASEGDLLEQAQPVPAGDEERQGDTDET